MKPRHVIRIQTFLKLFIFKPRSKIKRETLKSLLNFTTMLFKKTGNKSLREVNTQKRLLKTSFSQAIFLSIPTLSSNLGEINLALLIITHYIRLQNFRFYMKSKKKNLNWWRLLKNQLTWFRSRQKDNLISFKLLRLTHDKMKLAI